MDYPPCANRLIATVKGVPAHVKCAQQTKDCYMRLVQPLDCRRCLGLEPKEATKEDDSPEPPTSPGIVRRAISYAEALAQWTVAGRPERADKDVEQIFEHFCKCCRWYDRRKNICKGCGCRLANDGYAIRNKIKMATEHCPRSLW